MCNLYKIKSSRTEIADFFDSIGKSPVTKGMTSSGSEANTAEQVYPGYPAHVFAKGDVKAMTWGFPLHRKGAKGQPLKPKPVNNTRTDKVKSYFWRSSFEHRRCLIPVTSFAEAEGAKGAMTRTWFADSDGSMLAMAGIWSDTDEWGAAYSMLMTEANRQVAPIHDRMPVILTADQWDRWLTGSPQEAFALCQPYNGSLAIDRTEEPWFKSRA